MTSRTVLTRPSLNCSNCPVRTVMFSLHDLSFLSAIVSEHQNFEEVPYAKQLKINLILNSSLVHLYYTPNNGHREYLLLDRGEFTNASGASYLFVFLLSLRKMYCAVKYIYICISFVGPNRAQSG